MNKNAKQKIRNMNSTVQCTNKKNENKKTISSFINRKRLQRYSLWWYSDFCDCMRSKYCHA